MKPRSQARSRGRRRPTTSAIRLDERLRRIQRLVMQGELAATAVHEISNLQTIVLFNAGLLQEENRDNAAIGRQVTPLLHAATLVAALCNQLRNLARPVDPLPRIFDLTAEVGRVHSLLHRIIPRGLEYQASRRRAVHVLADPGQVGQMLINLVLNARDATSPEGGRIVIRVGESRGRRGFLEVEDNGTGMTEEVKSRLFEIFFTTKPAGHGTGLGLVTVRRHLEEMGGRIEVHSREGRGTRIRLQFPSVTEGTEIMKERSA